eukprot:gnl/TRDRNA2_/TRDRNA2_36440_c0_seq1.p1 gnl/TRDRNA2_/TRDRNA2_36440_c0~~gnl/TRDRNA2_/TRDRNA2_36440_c0_seq1.p1  ORF type:complete len:335 (+),score=64.53 gnl/TRDRNA2_/TRDRNA2_36440_c0_seq1:81-1007(+)
MAENRARSAVVVADFIEFIGGVFPEFKANDISFVKEALGSHDVEEILELVNTRDDLSDLDKAGMKKLHVNKLFKAIMQKKRGRVERAVLEQPEVRRQRRRIDTAPPRPQPNRAGPEDVAADIGEFGKHESSLGIEFLKGSPASGEALRMVVHAAGAKWGSSYDIYPEPALLSEVHRKSLAQLLDEKYHGECDLKLRISENELTEVIGTDAFEGLRQLFGAEVDMLYLRRTEACGQCINFHKDVSKRTLHLALNDHTDYVGGRLAYITPDGLEFPVRPSGCATIHDNTIVHGVTPLESGVRYGLFLLAK